MLSDFTDHLSIHEEQCAGKDCTNQGKHLLTVLYLNKRGWFCNTCKQELVDEGLTMENNEEDR